MNDPATDHAFKLAIGLFMIALGIFMLVRPEALSSIDAAVGGSYPNLGWELKARLRQVVNARVQAESINMRFTQVLGIITAILGVVELVPAVPILLPYVTACVALAFQVLAVYLQVRRATTRRAASLAPRKTPVGLPPLMLIGATVCLAGTAAYAALVTPTVGSSAMFVIFSMVVMFAVAWRIAVSPALLLGADVQIESFVDERLRVVRTSSIVNLACMVGFLGIIFAPHKDTTDVTSVIQVIADPLLATQIIATFGFLVVGGTMVYLHRKPVPSLPA